MKIKLIISVLIISLVIGVGAGLFVIKHEVKILEKELSKLNIKIKQDQKSIHILNAEWSHLNNPSRLRKLSQKYLGLKPIKPNQITNINSIPFDNKATKKQKYAKSIDYDTKSLDSKMRSLVSMESEQ